MTKLRKPTAIAVADPAQLQRILQAIYDAVDELQGIAQTPTPASIAAATGKTDVVVIRGATVTLPGSAVTFTADVYATGIRL